MRARAVGVSTRCAATPRRWAPLPDGRGQADRSTDDMTLAGAARPSSRSGSLSERSVLESTSRTPGPSPCPRMSARST
eukprot:2677812-Pyramimonas_sp.AAC.1